MEERKDSTRALVPVERFLRLGVVALLLLCGTSLNSCQGRNIYVRVGHPYMDNCTTDRWYDVRVDRIEVTTDTTQPVHQTINGNNATLVIKNYTGDLLVYRCGSEEDIFKKPIPPEDNNVSPYPGLTLTEQVNRTLANTTRLSCTFYDRRLRPVPKPVWVVSLVNGSSFNVSGKDYDVPILRGYTGNYTCVVSNEGGTLLNTTQLLIQYLPAVSIVSPGATADGIVREESTLRLRCSGNAIPSVMQVVLNFTNYSTNITTVLKSELMPDGGTWVEHNITNVQQKEHSGEYMCGATNAIGTSYTSISITVVAKPSAPLNLTIHNTSQTSLTLTWQEPISDGNSTITGYYANCTSLSGITHAVITLLRVNMTEEKVNLTNSMSNSTMMVTMTNNRTYSMNVSDLRPGENYTCYVFASNYAGNGTTSTSVSVTLDADKPCTPEFAVVNVTEPENLNGSMLQICLTWQVECSGGREILNCSLSRSDGHKYLWPGSDSLCAVDGTNRTFCDSFNLRASSMYTYSFSIANSFSTSTSESHSAAIKAIMTTPSLATVGTKGSSSSSGLSTGAIIGIVIAAIVAIIIIIIIVVLLLRSSEKSKEPTYDQPRYESEPVGIRYSRGLPGPGNEKDVKYTSVDFKNDKEPQQPKGGRKDTTQYALIDQQKTKSQTPVVPDDADGSTIV